MDRLLQTILREVSRISIHYYTMIEIFTLIHTRATVKWLTIKMEYWRTCSSSLYFYTEWLFSHSQQDECDLDMTGAPLAACICQILASQLSNNLFPREQDEEYVVLTVVLSPIAYYTSSFINHSFWNSCEHVLTFTWIVYLRSLEDSIGSPLFVMFR